MSINNFPASIQNVIEQQNYLETKLRKSIHAQLVLRQAAAAKSLEYFDAKIGETKTFTRSNPIAPNATPINPASDTGLDNGLTPINRSFEQWEATLNKWMGGVNLDIEGNETLLGDLFIDNMVELAAGAENSLEVVCMQRAMTAYDSGDTFALAAVGPSLTAHVDNINGFLTQYLTANAPSFGLPQAVSTTNKIPVLTISGTTGAVTGHANVTGVASDSPTNDSYMQTGGIAFGQSGVLTFDADVTVAVGDRIVAMDPSASTAAFNPTYKDGSFVVRPLNGSGAMIGTGYAMGATNVISPSQQVAQAVGLLRRRRAPKLRNGLYGCAIDSTLLSAFYEDTGFQRATQGTYDRSPVFADGLIAKGWGVEFVEASQLPVYVSPNGGFPLRHAFCFGEDVISEHPFIGARNAVSRVAGIGDAFDIRWSDRIRFISQVPLDRAAENVKMTYKYTGDFEPGTDKGSNPSIVFTSDYCRYKRGVVIQAASAI